MVLLDLFITYGPWAWFVAGLVLLALELVVPGGYFLWLGTAGLVTGAARPSFRAISWPWQVTIFGVLGHRRSWSAGRWLRATASRRPTTRSSTAAPSASSAMKR